MSRVATVVGTPEIEAAEQVIVATDGENGDRGQPVDAGEQKGVIRPDERSQPGFVEGRELGRYAREAVDETDLRSTIGLELLPHRQMPHLVVGVEQYERDRIEAVRAAQPVRDLIEQGNQRIGLQQRQLPGLCPLENGIVLLCLPPQHGELLPQAPVLFLRVAH